jgi:hypothetical protein
MKILDFVASEIDDMSADVANERLPLFHTTPIRKYIENEKRMADISLDKLEKGKLERNYKMCPEYKEYLLYFFYGKPAYRTFEDNGVLREQIEKTGHNIINLFPVIFILKSDLQIRRIHPFDSGAYYDFYQKDNFINSQTKREEYELRPNDFDVIQKYIKLFFCNNDHYYHGQRTSNTKINKLIKKDKKILDLTDLIDEGRNKGIDDRRKTVEIMSEKDCILQGNLLAVIAPASFIHLYHEYIEKYEVPYFHYPILDVDKVDTLMEAIYESVIKCYKTINIHSIREGRPYVS